MSDILTATLSNGIKLAHSNTDRDVAYIAVIINIGSRDESEIEHGFAHFTEHMLFKGTQKRKAYHILTRLEDVGGEVDAYTTKEETCLWVAILKEHYERAFELLSDILFNSTFPQKEIDKEKDVIIDEINSYKDNPIEQLFEDFEGLLFNGHPLSHNILGSKKVLKKASNKSLFNFYKNKYNPNQIIICSLGNIDNNKVTKYFTKYFENNQYNSVDYKREIFSEYNTFFIEKKKRLHQAHCVIGNIAYSYFNNKRAALVLLNNILGGHGMNSILNMILREKNGLVYNAESTYNPYMDTGMFSIYFGCDAQNLDKALKLIHNQLNNLSQNKLSPQKLNKAKQQIIGQIAISLENPESLLFGLGKSYLNYGYIDSFDNLKEKINNISLNDIIETAQEIFNPEKLSTIIYK